MTIYPGCVNLLCKYKVYLLLIGYTICQFFDFVLFDTVPLWIGSCDGSRWTQGDFLKTAKIPMNLLINISAKRSVLFFY